MVMEIRTDRLRLRPLQDKDLMSVYEYRSDAYTNRYQGWIPRTPADMEQFLSMISTNPDIPGTWYQLVIIESESGKLIGDIGLHFLNPVNKVVELGITLSRSYHGRGYATEALRALIALLFSDLKKHRLFASIDPDNIGSIRLFERLGFRKEAHFVKSLFLDDRWVDDTIYGLLAEEWEG